MGNYSSVDKAMVNLRRNTKWDLGFIESYRAFISKDYNLENIFAIFSYQPLLSESAENEKDRRNMLSQLGELKLCDLKELNLSEGERDILEGLYLEEYYRKNQFLKILLSKEMDNSIIVSANEKS